MPTEVRTSPSGAEVSIAAGADSVFGRVGDVVAVADDYDGVEVTNLSLVPGATVEDALDFLLANPTPYIPGSLVDSFTGGSDTNTVASNNANVGDFGWNIAQSGSGVVGPTCNKLSAAGTNARGIYRLTSPTAATSTPAGFSVFLGAPGAGLGPLQWNQLDEARWRARFDPTPASTNISPSIGFADQGAGGNLITVSFLVVIGGVGASPNYQCVANNATLGGFTTTTTSVPVDTAFHDFIIRRIDDTTIDYLIDGVVVATINAANTVPAPTNTVVPRFTALTGASGAQTPSFVDVDTFELVPLAA